MDGQDVGPGIPEWRPTSSTASALDRSTAASSAILPSQVGTDLAHFEYDVHKLPYTGRDIAPYETMAAHTLTTALQSAVKQSQQLNETKASSAASQASGSTSFPEVVELSLETIRYNSKWFTQEDLTELLLVALEHGSESMVANDLYACINLIITISTYATIPRPSIPAIARLLAYAYWQGDRTHKHDPLRKSAWHASKALLQTHLRDQLVDAMLAIMRLGSALETKQSFAQISGSLMIVRDKILFGKDQNDRDSVPLPAFLQALAGVASGGNDLQSQVLDTLEKILGTRETENEMHRLVLWPQYVDLIEKCQGEADDMVEPALDGLARIQLETTESLRVARIYLQTERPLPEIWSTRLLQHYSVRDLQEDDAFDDVNHVVSLLAQSKTHGSLFDELVQKHVSVIIDSNDLVKLKLVLSYYEDKICGDGATEQAAEACTHAIAAVFKTTLRIDATHATLVFGSLCQVAKNGPLAARKVALGILLRIRANARREIYISGETHMTGTSTLLKSVNDTGNDEAPRQEVSNYFDLTTYEYTLLDIFNLGDWETFDFVLTRLSDQLANQDLFLPNIRFLEDLRSTIAKLIENTESVVPPYETGYTKSYITMGLVRLLTTMIGYHHHFSRKDLFETLGVFLRTTGSRDHDLSIHCIHALTICCYELSELVTSRMEAIIDKMTKMVTQRFVAVHVLEFLAGLCRLPKLYRNFRQDDFKRIFAVCRTYLAHIHSKGDSSIARLKPPSVDSSSIEGTDDSNVRLPTYIYALTHHLMTFWYIAMKPLDRAALRPYISRIVTELGETIDDQGLVVLDMMDRIDAEEANTAIASCEEFGSLDTRIVERHRLVGLMLISTKTSLRSGKSHVLIRRSTGSIEKYIKGSTIKASTEGDNCLPILDDHVGDMDLYGRIVIPDPSSRLGSRTVLSLKDTSETGLVNDLAASQTSLSTVEANIPEADLRRAIESLDRIPALDSHKAAVIYIGDGQVAEADILRNTMGSPDYVDFIHGLGEVRRLKGATFNSQGLDRSSDTDGEFVIAWNSEVAELVYHTTTMMPTRHDTDPQCIQKKAHIGNDFVKIFFNNSGGPYDVDTIPSAFNYVNIVVTPSAKTSFLATRAGVWGKDEEQRFYEVRLITRDEFPAISSAAHPKIVSGASLPHYVRNLALNACVFSLLWSSGIGNGEYPSLWRARLDSIRRLWERYGKVSV